MQYSEFPQQYVPFHPYQENPPTFAPDMHVTASSVGPGTTRWIHLFPRSMGQQKVLDTTRVYRFGLQYPSLMKTTRRTSHADQRRLSKSSRTAQFLAPDVDEDNAEDQPHRPAKGKQHGGQPCRPVKDKRDQNPITKYHFLRYSRQAPTVVTIVSATFGHRDPKGSASMPLQADSPLLQPSKSNYLNNGTTSKAPVSVPAKRVNSITTANDDDTVTQPAPKKKKVTLKPPVAPAKRKCEWILNV
ncbi:hypothetical protein JVT61DRAFT_6088 [Boletus reticuloceps]|uniref:Uncharacterized protein n=1 Tax=Boletus reticuloceps TaxID=495285 RepID=A0A8I2YL55_9AGAM|nr:hypothetical protein JVT61DRAFT_6088 [Boletus reticuloceps]